MLETTKKLNDLNLSEFVSLVGIGVNPITESTVLALANRKGLGATKTRRLLELGVHEGLLIRRRIKGKNHVVLKCDEEL